MDKKDVKILVELAKNSRIPATRIAKMLGISDVAVKKRLAKLEKGGYIKGYQIVVDPVKLGFRVVAYIGVNIDSDKIIEVAQKLASWDDVVYVAVTSGDHDVMAEVWAKSSNEMHEKLEKIRQLEGVRNVYPAIVLDVIKSREAFPINVMLKEV